MLNKYYRSHHYILYESTFTFSLLLEFRHKSTCFVKSTYHRFLHVYKKQVKRFLWRRYGCSNGFLPLYSKFREYRDSNVFQLSSVMWLILNIVWAIIKYTPFKSTSWLCASNVFCIIECTVSGQKHSDNKMKDHLFFYD